MCNRPTTARHGFAALAMAMHLRDRRFDLWRVAIAPSHAAEVVDQVGSSLWVGDWAGGLLWIATNDGQKLREVVAAAGGYAILMRADEQTRAGVDVFEREDPVRAQLTRSVKAAFDPLGLFNPGRMWDGV